MNFLRKYSNVRLLEKLFTNPWFPLENILIPNCWCTFGETFYCVWYSVQRSSESTKFLRKYFKLLSEELCTEYFTWSTVQRTCLILQRRFPLKYVNLCKILLKLYLQLMQNRAQVKAFNALELSPYSSIMYLFMLTSNVRYLPVYLANLS
jgi:hypothetical protein